MIYIGGSPRFGPGNFDLLHVFPRWCNVVFNRAMDAFNIAVCNMDMKRLTNFGYEIHL